MPYGYSIRDASRIVSRHTKRELVDHNVRYDWIKTCYGTSMPVRFFLAPQQYLNGTEARKEAQTQTHPHARTHTHTHARAQAHKDRNQFKMAWLPSYSRFIDKRALIDPRGGHFT